MTSQTTFNRRRFLQVSAVGAGALALPAISYRLALPEVSADFPSRAAFVVGAFLSSLSWQEFLAVVGAMLHGRLTPRLQRITAVVSSIIILALAVRVAFG